ncbi:MAG: GDP-mannose 4,6-dehydratase [Chloroflexi bacterium]|nr:GDP-mannose 4,6-dehydratase [Chloroflexota bacterium]
MRVLITGVGGFAGSHLADCLLTDPDAELWGTVLPAGRPAYLAAAVHRLAVDLRDPQAVRQIIQSARPERVYHLAGQAFVPQSHRDPWDTLENNLRPQLNLFESLLAESLRPRMLVVGSYEVYARRPSKIPLAGLPGQAGAAPEIQTVGEDWPLGPDSPYGVSKVAQDFLARQYFETYDLPVIRVRPFNHIGPRQSPRFVAAAFASQIARIRAGQQPAVLRVGNLAARRDFTDVRDMVRGYALLLERGAPGEVYNLGSGASHSIQELLDRLLALAGVACEVTVDPERYRPLDAGEVLCDASRAFAACGWRPEIPFDVTLADLLAYEEQRLDPATPTPAA